MTTVNWTISTLDRDVATGFVRTCHWQATAVDGDYTASVYSTCGFATATPAIPYASVTEAEVLDWCWANGVDKTAVEASLASQIALQKNPVTATGGPW